MNHEMLGKTAHMRTEFCPWGLQPKNGRRGSTPGAVTGTARHALRRSYSPVLGRMLGCAACSHLHCQQVRPLLRPGTLRLRQRRSLGSGLLTETRHLGHQRPALLLDRLQPVTAAAVAPVGGADGTAWPLQSLRGDHAAISECSGVLHGAQDIRMRFSGMGTGRWGLGADEAPVGGRMRHAGADHVAEAGTE